MAASRTGLHHFKDSAGASVYAAQITEITPFNRPGAPHGSKRLYFADLDKQVNVIGQWVMDHGPSVGGYFIVEDSPDMGSICRYMPEGEFVKQYTGA